MNILGVKIDNLAREEIFEKVENFLAGGKFHQIATLNPEFILRAQKDQEFKNILNNCDLNVADGVGIWFAFLRFGKYLKARMTGIDLMMEILRLADKKKLNVFLAASNWGLSTWKESAEAIKKKYPNIKVGGANFDPKTAEVVNYESGIGNYAVVFCNFGAPEQEKLLRSLKNRENAKISLAMGVGGSFDYLAGKVRRAPVLMRKLGLEWLWRLIQQPQRIKRIWNAVIIFPIKIITTR